MNIDARKFSMHALFSIGGIVAGVKLWRAHPVIGGILGFVVGGHVGTVVLGFNPIADAVKATLTKEEPA